jgi:hypothetical protein
LADLGDLDVAAWTVQGAVLFKAAGKPGAREITITTPADGEGELVLPVGENVPLTMLPGAAPEGCVRYRLPAGKTTDLRLKYK